MRGTLSRLTAPAVTAGLADAQMALAVTQLNKQATTSFWKLYLDVSRITHTVLI